MIVKSFVNILSAMSLLWVTTTVFFTQTSFADSLQKSIFPVPRPIFFESLKPRSFDSILTYKKIEADIGFILYDIDSSKILEAINPSTQYPLASLTKLVTAKYANEILGPEHVFTTTIEAIGEENNGVLKGDFILRGGSDPTLSSDDFFRLVDNLWDIGLRKVEGRFIVDPSDTIYHREIEPGQPEYLSHNSSISGLNLNFNRLLFEWEKVDGIYSFNYQAKSENSNLDVSTTDVSLIEKKKIYQDNDYNGNNDNWFFEQSFLDKAKKRWLPVRNPANYAAELFWRIANDKGIELPKPEISYNSNQGKVLAEVRSKRLVENIELMLRYSNNLLSEAIGLSATKKLTGNKRKIKDSAKIMKSWLETKIGKYEGNFSDHSGLGVASKMSAYEFIQFFENLGWHKKSLNLMQNYKIKKTQSSILKNYTKVVKAKTGTLNYVGNTAGYIETKSGRKLFFVIFNSNLDQRNLLVRSERDNPPGANIWNKKIRSLHLDIINKWALKYN